MSLSRVQEDASYVNNAFPSAPGLVTSGLRTTSFLLTTLDPRYSLHRGNPALHPASHMYSLSPEVQLAWMRREKPCLTGHLCSGESSTVGPTLPPTNRTGRETSQHLTLACLSPTKYTDDIGILLACY